ncbi:MAG: hypothetical protein SCALA702_19550 [Melioribacteraceae bacterium]|nr:MAG: hypothetical protein SCALA702_19550 [Melioribacteraceae bacterium]
MAKRFDKNSSVVIVGAGKIAYTLGRELVSGGYNFNSVFSKSFSSARELAFYLELDNCSDMSGLNVAKFDVFFLTVPDSQIRIVANSIASSGEDITGKLFVHLSGSKSSVELKELENKGATTASMHIMQTFPQRAEEVDLTSCYCALESKDKAAIKYLQQFGDFAGLKCFTLSSNEKVYYHLSGVVAANFINANFQAAMITSDKIKNIPPVLGVLHPTAKKTLKNIKKKGVSGALSGPVQRNDIDTIKAHVRALKRMLSEDNPETYYLLTAYLSQSMLLVTTAEYRGEEYDYSELKSFLKDELKQTLKLFE